MNRWHTIKFYEYLKNNDYISRRKVVIDHQGFIEFNNQFIMQSIYKHTVWCKSKKRIMYQRMINTKYSNELVVSCQNLLSEMSSSPSYTYAFLQPDYSEPLAKLFEKHKVPFLDYFAQGNKLKLECSCGIKGTCDHDKISYCALMNFLEVRPMTFFNILGLTNKEISLGAQGRFKLALLPENYYPNYNHHQLPNDLHSPTSQKQAVPLIVPAKNRKNPFLIPLSKIPNPQFLARDKKIGVELAKSALNNFAPPSFFSLEVESIE